MNYDYSLYMLMSALICLVRYIETKIEIYEIKARGKDALITCKSRFVISKIVSTFVDTAVLLNEALLLR